MKCENLTFAVLTQNDAEEGRVVHETNTQKNGKCSEKI